jgi:1-deoxy-D-xylulose-5-phosphate reductoisomerase
VRDARVGPARLVSTLAYVKKVVVLGSTGSIGEQALEVIQAAGDELELVGISAHSSWEQACAQADRLRVPRIAIADPGAAERCAAERSGVLAGEEGVRELIATSGADLVLNAITGSAGLGPTIVALTEGIDLALANKESLVVGGELVTALAEATGAAIIPVDSEHSALFQLIGSEPTPGSVDRLVLTASGGPFRERRDLSGVTVAEALAHPTWEMGGRITIDSATLFNKGLELIEAHHLFGFAYDAIDVVVHPQSIVHSLIQLNDGASLAHLGYPDMRVPISYALHYPDRADVPMPSLDLATVGSLDFETPDLDRFPCLRLAREAGEAGGTAPCVLNAADEVAVAAFLEERIPFTAIPQVVERALEEMPPVQPTHFQDLYAVDDDARERARDLVEGAIA